MNLISIQGSFVAIVTPFRENGDIDETAFENLVRWHIESGTNGIIVCATTGENATLTVPEREKLVAIARRECEGRLPVICGVASNNTAEAVRQAEWAKSLNVDGILVLSPYYNKPPGEGLFQHFKAVAGVGVPSIIYNVPGRTGSNVPAEVVLRLAREVPGILAVKEASGNMSQIMDILREISQGTSTWASSGFSVLLGDDALTMPLMALGARGCVSVVANEMPREFSEMVSSALAGDYKTAARLHFRMLPLMNANFMETNPLPVKTALSFMGRIKPVFRLPLTPMQSANAEKILKILASLNLVNQF